MAHVFHEPRTIPAERLRRKSTPSDVDRPALARALSREVDGEVRFDSGSRGLYATDASNYRQIPLGVVVPKSIDAVIATVATCRRLGAPIVSRGGGTGLAGQTCNRAVVIDFSKYLNRILEVDAEGRFARVEPGVVCDDLVEAGKPYSLTWGPQPATHSHCCFGGMIANDCGGIHAQIHGTAVNNVEELDVLLYDGTRMRVGWMTEADLDAAIERGGRAGEVYARIKALRTEYGHAIQVRYPEIPRRVSGYNLDQLLPRHGRFNVARALVGSEGTLATTLEAKVHLVWNHPARALAAIGFDDVYRAADAVPAMLAHAPIGLEGLDDRLVENVRKKGGPHATYLPLLPKGRGWLFAELGFATQDEAITAGYRLLQTARGTPGVVSAKLVTDPDEQTRLWQVRESGLGSTAFVPGEPDAWPGWEDSAVPPERLGGYLRDLRALFERYGYSPALYGHFGMGCVHCRVDFELTTAEGISRYRSFVGDAADLVVRYGGSLSGEHGDGQSRAELLGKMFGAELVRAFGEYKAIWDPDDKMNPGKVVDPNPIVSHLRLGAGYAPHDLNTHFRYPDDNGSFAHATLRCVGVGKCRRSAGAGENQTMCPSYMVTREERHTTRGRAHLLWEMLQDGPIRGNWKSEDVKESLDLCLSCKGCKGDCPVNVDIATYKAEFLSHYWKRRIRPRHAYAYGRIDLWARLASAAPGLANLATQAPGLRDLAKLVAGAPRRRSIPPFAPQTFRSAFARRPPGQRGAPRVVLWADTFNNYFFPDTAMAAVRVLESAGYEVVVPRGHLCCGRPLYDYGMLDLARRYLDRCLRALLPHLDGGASVVVLEPSCASVFRDELLNLLPDRQEARQLAARTKLLGEFLREQRYEPPPLHRRAVVHGHCHHKSVLGFGDERDVLRDMELTADILDSGCCGMAGSFGFERDKFELSQAIGERVLLPAVRKASESTLIIADGFSCREQIAQNTERGALHLAEVIDMALQRGREGPTTSCPEQAIVAQRRRGVLGSMVRAALSAAAVVGAAVLWRRLMPARSHRPKR